MPTYVFQADDGQTIERFLPISRCPDLGDVITEDGKAFKRILSLGSSQVRKEFKPYIT